MSAATDAWFERMAAGELTPKQDLDYIAADIDGWNPYAAGTVYMAMLSGPYPISGDKRLESTWRP